MLEVCSEYTYRLELPASLKRLFPVIRASLLFRSKDEGMAVLSQEDEFQDRLFLDNGSISNRSQRAVEEAVQETLSTAPTLGERCNNDSTSKGCEEDESSA